MTRPLGSLPASAVLALLADGTPRKRIAFLAGVAETSVRRWLAAQKAHAA